MKRPLNHNKTKRKTIRKQRKTKRKTIKRKQMKRKQTKRKQIKQRGGGFVLSFNDILNSSDSEIIEYFPSSEVFHPESKKLYPQMIELDILKREIKKQNLDLVPLMGKILESSPETCADLWSLDYSEYKNEEGNVIDTVYNLTKKLIDCHIRYSQSGGSGLTSVPMNLPKPGEGDPFSLDKVQKPQEQPQPQQVAQPQEAQEKEAQPQEAQEQEAQPQVAQPQPQPVVEDVKEEMDVDTDEGKEDVKEEMDEDEEEDDEPPMNISEEEKMETEEQKAMESIIEQSVQKENIRNDIVFRNVNWVDVCMGNTVLDDVFEAKVLTAIRKMNIRMSVNVRRRNETIISAIYKEKEEYEAWRRAIKSRITTCSTKDNSIFSQIKQIFSSNDGLSRDCKQGSSDTVLYLYDSYKGLLSRKTPFYSQWTRLDIIMLLIFVETRIRLFTQHASFEIKRKQNQTPKHVEKQLKPLLAFDKLSQEMIKKELPLSLPSVAPQPIPQPIIQPQPIPQPQMVVLTDEEEKIFNLLKQEEMKGGSSSARTIYAKPVNIVNPCNRIRSHNEIQQKDLNEYTLSKCIN